jgi:hypothetical protein
MIANLDIFSIVKSLGTEVYARNNAALRLPGVRKGGRFFKIDRSKIDLDLSNLPPEAEVLTTNNPRYVIIGWYPPRPEFADTLVTLSRWD